MARPRGNLKATGPRLHGRENLTSLSTEAVCLRLHALHLPISGSKAELISAFLFLESILRVSDQVK